MRARICLIISFALAAFQLFSQNYTSRLFSTDQGLPDTYVYSVLQDKDGFLWIATGKGLVKFDGQVFTRYRLQDEDAEDLVYSGALDKNGDLWFGTYSGKLYKLDTTSSQLKPYSKQAGGSVNRIIASQKNSALYCFSKGSGIYVLGKNELKHLESTNNYQLNSVEWLGDDLLLAATSEGLFTINTSSDEAKPVKGWTGDMQHLQKLERSNSYAISTANAVYAIELNNDLNTIKEQHELTAGYKPGEISSFLLNEKNNCLYIGGRDEHFTVIDLKKGNHKVIDENDFSASANSIFTDRETNVWVSTMGKGLYRLFKTDFDFIDVNGAAVFAITQDDAGNTYYGTKKGIVMHNAKGEALRTVEKIDGRSLEKVNALLFDGTNLWIGTNTHGLFVVNAKTLAPVRIQFSSIENIAVNSIAANPHDKDVQVNTNLDGVYIYNSDLQIRHHFSVQNSLLHNNVYASVKGRNGRVYYATHNTAFNFSLNDQVYEVEIKTHGLISDFNAFAENRNGNIMIATNGDGVYQLDDTIITHFALNSRLESRFCNGLMYDNRNNLWIMQRYGLYCYYSADNILKKIQLNMNKLLFNPNAVYKNPKGDLYFGTDKNVVLYESDSSAVSYPPHSYLLEVKLFDSVIPFANNTEFKHGKYNLSFDYSALCLKNSEDVMFRYLLEGRDDEWSEPTRLRHVEFSNLGEGNYTFKVIAISSDGVQEITPTHVSFTIQRAFWKNPVFWISVIVVLLILFFVILRLRTAALVKAKLRLEAVVDEKTKELREEKETVEKNSQVIEAQHHEITQSINYAKRIQEAILPVFEKQATERQPEIMIYFQPKDIVSGDFYWHTVKDHHFMVAACDCTGHGVPGAFMSLIGSTLLNKIVLDKGIVAPKEILSEMDSEISVSLKQESNEVRDGMEAAVCSVDLKSRTLYYSGAKRPLWLFRKTAAGYALEEFSASKFPIGGFADVKNKVFVQHEIPVSAGDTVYLFSDGIIDQFDHNNKKRLSTKRVRELLSSVVHLPLDQQQQQLQQYFNNWKQSTPQTDDVLVLGIRF